MRGALKAALTAGLTEVQRDPSSAEGWKLFLLAPRMLLYRGRGETRVPRAELDKRVELLAAGQCRDLLDSDVPGPSRANAADDDAQRRAERAAALAHLGELSAASAALTAMPMAPASLETLAALRDPERRPPTRQVPLPPDFRSSHPRDPLALNSHRFLRNVRSGRRGAAAGPSGCTAEHLRVLADDEASADLLLRAAERLANADVPADVLAGVRLGGGVRGLVMSDAFRRLVARTLAQQYAGAFQAACAPFQYALRTRAGAESLARAVRAVTELDARTTVLSIDGVRAYDHISRASMLSGLQHTPSLTALLPFVAQFYAEPSAYVFYDAEGAAHEMPALYALGQHPALLQAHAALTPGEDLHAYLDDIYVTCQPERAGPAFTALGTALWERANIRVHLGKTRAWNAAGEEPSALLDALPAAARADAWAGSWARPPAQQGITVLGTPLGHGAYIAGALRRVREKHDELLGRIPTVPHLQSAWLLLLLCAQARSNYLLRVLPPADTGEFAESHDRAIARCLGRLLSGTDEPFELSQLQAACAAATPVWRPWPPICRGVPGRGLLGGRTPCR